MKATRKNLPVLVLMPAALVFLGGCAPTLLVRHQDPSNQRINIIVDRSRQELVEYGDDLSLSLSEGVHRLDARTEEGDRNVWSADGQGWDLFLEDDAELTLVAPEEAIPGRRRPPPGQPNPQGTRGEP